VVNVHLSINFQIYNWRPEFYNDTKNLPEEMPRQLKKYILAVEKKNSREVSGHVFPYQMSIEPWDSIIVRMAVQGKIKTGICSFCSLVL